MLREDFGPDFYWGVGSAAYAVEGYPYTHEAGESIWDRFTRLPQRIRDHQTGDRACESYQRLSEDLDLLHQLGIPNYRFSVSWTRVLPTGVGEPNPAGLDYYDRLVDGLLERGVTPWLTVYHWDLPQLLEDRGGWANRDTVAYFADYAALLAQRLGDRVPNWLVLNEPAVFTHAGYHFGLHAPGKRDLLRLPAVLHHTALAQAEGARSLRAELGADTRIGTTFSHTPYQPASNFPWDRWAARRWNLLFNRLFVEAALGLGYPVQDFKGLRLLYRQMQAGDVDRLAFDFDFWGVQTFTREVVRLAPFRPLLLGQALSARSRGKPYAANDWEIFPESLYLALKQLAAYQNSPPLVVTQTGLAFTDLVQGQRVHDAGRTHYLREYLAQVLRARQEGVEVRGFFIWSLLDQFGWDKGYSARYGLVHVNHETQQRRIKDSGLWYRDFLAGAPQTAAAGTSAGQPPSPPTNRPAAPPAEQSPAEETPAQQTDAPPAKNAPESDTTEHSPGDH